MDRLSLTLEPECAALFCLGLSKDQMATHHNGDTICSDEVKTYLILDIGGGTVDITAQVRVGPGNYKVVVPPVGDDYGGMKVNENFRSFLGKIVEDSDFSKFLAESKDNKATLHKIIYHNFEKIKIKFGKTEEWESFNASAPNRLNLEAEFVRFYTEEVIRRGIEKHADSRVKLSERRDILIISNSKMAEFFHPVLAGIKTCVTKALQHLSIHEIDVVYVAGGFGGCQFISSWLIKDIFMHTINRKKIAVFSPIDHKLAVSRGAVLYCRNPGAIRARKMDAYYGKSVLIPFKEDVHKESYAWHRPEDGEKLCDNVFSCFVLQNEEVKVNDVFVSTSVPSSQSNKSVLFEFYRSTNENIQYVTDANTKKIGRLEMELPNPGNVPRTERTLEVTMSFSSTEIQAHARALYLPGKPEVKTILDFLCN